MTFIKLITSSPSEGMKIDTWVCSRSALPSRRASAFTSGMAMLSDDNEEIIARRSLKNQKVSSHIIFFKPAPQQTTYWSKLMALSTDVGLERG